MDTRTYWLKQYRYVINNGVCKFLNYSYNYDWQKQGVKTFRLVSEKIYPHENKFSNNAYLGLNYSMQKRKMMWGNIKSNDIYRTWRQRCTNSRNSCSYYKYNTNMLKFLSNWELFVNLKQNGIDKSCIPSTRQKRIKMLISI